MAFRVISSAKYFIKRTNFNPSSFYGKVSSRKWEEPQIAVCE